MNKFSLFSCFLLIIATSALAQGDEQRTLSVTGTSHLSVSPDQVVVNMTVQALEMEFNDAIKTLNNKTEKLTKSLGKGGFDEEDIKTTNFSVRKNTIYDQGKSYDSGYVAMQSVILKFDYSKDRLGDLMKAYSKSLVDVNLNFNFQLSEQKHKSNTDQLITMAIEDAKSKALIIAGAAGIKLIEIKSIQYGTEQDQPQPVPAYARMKAMNSESAGSADLSPQNIDLYDEVRITWHIQ